MSGATGNRLLIGLAATCGFLAIVGIGLELATDRWLSMKLGIAPVFISTPMGVGALLLSILTATRIHTAHAIFPSLLALVFWGLFLVYF